MKRLSLILALLAIAVFAAGPVFAKAKSGSHAHHSSSGSHHSATHHSATHHSATHHSAAHHSGSHSHPGNHPSSTRHSAPGNKHNTTNNPAPSANGANNSTPAQTTTTRPATTGGVTGHGRSSSTHSRGYHRGYHHVSHRRNSDRPSFLVGPDQTVVMNSGAHVVTPWATILSGGSNRNGGRALHFEVTGNSNSALFVQSPSVSPTGTLGFTPAIGQSGTATITLVLRSSGGSSAPQTFQITVKPA